MDNNFSVKIKNLSKKIKENIILNDINVNFSYGEINGIIGINGSGKTMLFKTICGLTNYTSGEIYVFNKLIKNGEFPDDTGIIIESPGFLPNYSGFKNLQILASIKNIISDDDIRYFIELVGLNPNDNRPVKKYSLGMRQRLGIAQALMEKPKLLILDEPMNALDETGVSLVRKILLDLKSKGITILLASHNKDDINTLCDNIYEIKNGNLIKYKSN
ncbi:ABC transporter ATP-binding protein [Clostridium perfringens]|uniref:ABC transporter ATP-binding protein n=2 Tax=Clostridium perfringens TaxID=1502 RepID=A0AAP7BXB2_CLOPF|nr:ABC transporter ATP-binding protein [Clostridium perfringens]EDT23828.1 bacitracin transport ATP-binding protein BcrA [Clostridium perfringens B str. ATCC 3626]MDU7548469.1 ABC transporter ATP-binding protein [Clostridium perfringens]NGU31851.1 ABC transporter ATP-binding protein [Clostridium perfringens]WEV05985.1 ABC transporter ATP-binding protein [Clostridium perfringens B]VTQ55034.1 antibiotic ABC transporter ATP-binding protein [Clostridium perfringens]